MIDKRVIKNLINDEIEVSLIDGKDKWGKVTFQEPFVVEKVRFDRSSVDKSTNTQSLTNVIRNHTGVIFIYPKITPVIVDDSWLQAKVTDAYSEYKIVGYKINHYLGKIFSYEIEVI